MSVSSTYSVVHRFGIKEEIQCMIKERVEVSKRASWSKAAQKASIGLY
jgi:hypothetical protein